MSGFNRDTQGFIRLVNRNARKAANGDAAAQQQVKDCWIKLKRAPGGLLAKIYDELTPQARALLELALDGGRVIQNNDDRWVPFKAEPGPEPDEPIQKRHDPRARTSYQ